MAAREHGELERGRERRRAVVEEDRDPERTGRLADALQARLVRREALQPGMELDPAHPVLADAALDLRRGARVARIDRRERDEPVGRRSDPGCERVVGARARPQQPFVGEHDRDVHAELVHRRQVLRRPVGRGGGLVDVEVDHAGTDDSGIGRPTPAARAIRSASSRLAIASSRPGTGGVPASAASTKR